MNRTPNIIAELRDEIANAPVCDLPSIVGQVAALHAEALARIITGAQTVTPQPDDQDRLLTAEEVAARLGDGYTSRWVRDHREEFPRVTLPGRNLRFSERRLNALIRKRSFG